MKTFDVFLKDRLTKLDIIISTLVSREIFSFYDKMLINCVINELEFLKQIQGETSMEIDAELRRLSAKVHILAQSTMTIDLSADIVKGSLASGETAFLLKTVPADVLHKVYDDFQNYQILTAKLDSCDVKLSLGNADFINTLIVNPVETYKLGYSEAKTNVILLSNTDLSGKKVLYPNSIDLQLYSNPFGIFYLALIAGECVMNICTTAISEMTNYKLLHNVKFDTLLTVEINDSLEAIKYISGNSDIKLLSSVVWMLEKIIFPKISDMQLSCKASAGMYRRRLLSEMEGYVLADYTNMTLHDVGYILIE